MRFILLLAFTFTPFSALAYQNRTVIDVYQEAIQKLEIEYQKLKELTADAHQKAAELEEATNSVKTLIAKYEAALNTTKQKLVMKHEAQLKTIKEAYQKKLAGESDLAELARQSAEDDAKATRALLDKLGTSAEKVAKLTDVVTVSSDGKLGIGTKNPQTQLDVNGNIRLAHAPHNKKGLYSKTFMVNGEANTYYPVVIRTVSYGRVQNMQIWRHYSSPAPSTWHTPTHKGALMIELEMFGSAWGGNGNMYRIKNFFQQYSQVISKIERPRPAGYQTVLWLRGGGAQYVVEGDFEGVQGLKVYYEASKIYDHSQDKYDITVAPTTKIEQTFVNYSQNFSGNVGIGTSTPQYKLDVAGTIRGNNVSLSDQRHKQDIHTLEKALTKLQELRGVRFKWKDKAQGTDTQIGLIAQEVEKVVPELVSTDSEGYKSIAYGKLTAVLVEAIKALQQQNKKMAQQIEALKASQP
jgi:hypothetical protein